MVCLRWLARLIPQPCVLIKSYAHVHVCMYVLYVVIMFKVSMKSYNKKIILDIQSWPGMSFSSINAYGYMYVLGH